MAWLKKSEAHEFDEDEEARAGLIDPATTKAVPSTSKNNLGFLRPSLIALLILTNIAWAAGCLIIWRGSIRAVPNTLQHFEADFSTHIFHVL